MSENFPETFVVVGCEIEGQHDVKILLTEKGMGIYSLCSLISDLVVADLRDFARCCFSAMKGASGIMYSQTQVAKRSDKWVARFEKEKSTHIVTIGFVDPAKETLQLRFGRKDFEKLTGAANAILVIP